MIERPVECTQCKKPFTTTYKEIVGNAITCTQMCADCPILEQKLHGTLSKTDHPGSSTSDADLYCGKCHTAFEAVKMGNDLGCIECYTVFGDLLISLLMQEGKIPSKYKKGLLVRKNQPIHVGKSPGKALIPTPSSEQLTALHEALNEALKKENYEEAATLRDQIKKLTNGKSDEGKS